MTSTPTSRRNLSVIGAPSSAGAYGPGQERAPQTFRRYGLIAQLQSRGITVTDRGNGTTALWRKDEQNPTAGNVDAVAKVATELASTVATAMADGDAVLVLGGDCTVELGSVAGAIEDGSCVGLAYVDLDADLNTPETGDGILDWMGVAHLLDVRGAHPHLSSLGARRPMLSPDTVRLFGTHSVSEPERSVIEKLGLHVENLASVRDDLPTVAARTRDWAAQFDRVLVHVDADVLDYDQFPIAENTDSRSGLRLEELGRLLRILCTLPNWRCLTLAEINPAHAEVEREAFHLLIEMLGDALSA